ncbi:hypothetical protein [Pseudooctadecabacter sp.]|uniref:hypothetical protein n=1 Tax=Pseudooctadecabacter sp. TaxID=1966338 RepID=UPI0035C7C640
MAYRILFDRFLRLGPVALGIVSLLIFVGAYFLQVEMNKRQVEKLRALDAGAPAAVQVQSFDPARDVTLVREAVIEAQLLWNYSYDLWYEKEWSTDYVVMFPIVAANQTDPNRVLGFAMLKAEDGNFSTFTPEQVDDLLIDEGMLGPVMTLNGEVRGLGQWEGLVEESMFDMGLKMPEDAIVIWPFMEGREVALGGPKEGTMTIFGLLSKVAGAIGLLAIAKLAFRRKDDDEQVEDFDEGHDPQPDYAMQTDVGGYASGPEDDPVIVPARRFSLRKAAIGVVGGAFVLLAASVGYSMLATDAAPTTTVEASDVVAAPAAPVEVTDVVSTPSAQTADGTLQDLLTKAMAWVDAGSEWFAGLIDAAAAGDMTATVTLLTVVLGAFFGIIGLKKLFGLTGRFKLGNGDLLEDLDFG